MEFSVQTILPYILQLMVCAPFTLIYPNVIYTLYKTNMS